MKRHLSGLTLCIAALAIISCAKSQKTGPNEAGQRYFEAWASVQDLKDKTPLGSYIMESTQGDGAEIEEDGYVSVKYTISDLEGTISSFTEDEQAKQLGSYSISSYYGPKIWSTETNKIQTGVMEILKGVKVGGKVKAAIPSWLLTYKTYTSAEEYLKHSSSYTDAIYDIEVVDFTTDILEWQIDRIVEYFEAHRDVFPEMTKADSLADYRGFYYQMLSAPVVDKDEEAEGSEEEESEENEGNGFPSDTTIYINYTGKLLNGLVFDTTIEKIAKDNGLYSAEKTYEPVRINWGDNFSDITMGSNESSIITGFALTLWQMGAMEKGIGIFPSPYGYGATGTGSSIPGYEPLIFEIELVEKPEE